MQVSKVGGRRCAVSGLGDKTNGRGIVYSVSKSNNLNSKALIDTRVKDANNLYEVFYMAPYYEELEKHFEKIVGWGKKCDGIEDFIKTATNEKEIKEIEKYTLQFSQKNVYGALALYVRERMKEEWQEKTYRDAAVKILMCVCDQEYSKKIQELDKEQIEIFIEACKQSKTIFWEQNSRILEESLSKIIKELVKPNRNGKRPNISQIINKIKETYNKTNSYGISIAELVSDPVEENANGDKIQPDKERNWLEEIEQNVKGIYAPEYLTEDRLDAFLIRMRNAIEGDQNKKIIKHLLRSLAQGECSLEIYKMWHSGEEVREELRLLLKALTDDYYKAKVSNSIQKNDVKIQVSTIKVSKEEKLKKLDLPNVNKGFKKGLILTLERYANSEAESNKVLLSIKEILFEYVMPFDEETNKKFLVDSMLWKLPKSREWFFSEDITYLWDAQTIPYKVIKEKICEKNSERYRALIIAKKKEQIKNLNEEELIHDFWVDYINDYIERYYLGKDVRIKKDDCYCTRMIQNCWRDILGYLCAKYIDYGKAIFHFAMPESMSLDGDNVNKFGKIRDEYVNGISSFDYEIIKAEENLQRNIAKATVAAVAAFSRSAIKIEEQNTDILFLSDDEFRSKIKNNNGKQILRYFGGKSTIDAKKKEINIENLLVEMRNHFRFIRNDNFHYAPALLESYTYENTKKIWECDVDEYKQLIRDKYYSNNVLSFYDMEELRNLFIHLYESKNITQAIVPAFRNVIPRNEWCKVVNERIPINEEWFKDIEKRTIFDGASYFLLNEIYYNRFIEDESAKKLFIDAVDSYKGNKSITNSKKAAEDFRKTIARIIEDDQNISFESMCERINQEYCQQNTHKSKNNTEEKFAHFKMLLPLCIRTAFFAFLNQPEYAFLKKPKYKTICGQQEWLNDIKEIDCGVVLDENQELNKAKLAWFVFAHFVHPKQLNLLVGDIKNYIQYRENIFKRAEYAGEYSENKEDVQNQRRQDEEAKNISVEKAKEILKILEFIRPLSGRVSGKVNDYYDSSDVYMKYLKNYIHFSDNVSPTDDELLAFSKMYKFDVYADEQNPKILRNVEIARMYASGDINWNWSNLVEKEDIILYQEKKRDVANILSKGLCNTVEERKMVTEYQQLSNKILLNDITDSFSLLNDLIGELVSMAYLRERDKMYMLLGFYYLALRANDDDTEGWKKKECLDVAGPINLNGVLYQVVSMFDFGLQMPYVKKVDDKNTWMLTEGVSIGKKEKIFNKMHKQSKECAMRLFQRMDKEKEIRNIRNNMDHLEYYRNQRQSIMEIYDDFYEKFFGYSSKLRRSVIVNFQNVLERYFLQAEFNIQNKNLKLKNVSSTQFTYKIKEMPKTCKLNARSDVFVANIVEVLNYKNCGSTNDE